MICEYLVTFGQQYGRAGEPPHPTFPDAHRDGYVVIEAPNYETARAMAFARLGAKWSWLYDRAHDSRINAAIADGLFPRGELDRWTYGNPDSAI